MSYHCATWRRTLVVWHSRLGSCWIVSEWGRGTSPFCRRSCSPNFDQRGGGHRSPSVSARFLFPVSRTQLWLWNQEPATINRNKRINQSGLHHNNHHLLPKQLDVVKSCLRLLLQPIKRQMQTGAGKALDSWDPRKIEIIMLFAWSSNVKWRPQEFTNSSLTFWYSLLHRPHPNWKQHPTPRATQCKKIGTRSHFAWCVAWCVRCGHFCWCKELFLSLFASLLASRPVWTRPVTLELIFSISIQCPVSIAETFLPDGTCNCLVLDSQPDKSVYKTTPRIPHSCIPSTDRVHTLSKTWKLP